MRIRAIPGTLAGVRHAIVLSVRTCAASGPMVPITHATSPARSKARASSAAAPSSWLARAAAAAAEITSGVPPSLDPRAGTCVLATTAASTRKLGPGADHVSPSSFVTLSA